MSQFSQSPQEPILKPRDLGQLLDRSFKIYGRYWKRLTTVGLLAAIPGVIMGFVFGSVIPSPTASPTDNWLFRIFAAAEGGDFSGIIALGSIWLIIMLAILLLVPLYMGALVDVATRAVLHMEPVSLGESLRVAAGRYWALLGTYALKILIYIVAFPVFIIGGLLILAWITVPLGFLAIAVVTVFANHAIMIEGKGGGVPALTRAWELGRYRFWPLMGIGIVFNLLVYIGSSIVTTPFAMASAFLAVFSQSMIFMGLMYLFQGLAQAVVLPFLVVGQSLVYFDTRIRREGYDLEVLAQQQNQENQAAQPVIAPPPDLQP